ncbi:MAG: TraE/TraK family type IV conjugative transfer system protein [Alphaproteobacteria bacterium]
MKFSHAQATSLQTIKQRNFAYLVSLGLLVSNLFLAYKVFNQEERWVLIPQFDIHNKIDVQGDKYSKVYLEHWAGGLAQEMLTVNPLSVDRMVLKFLDLSSLNFGRIKPTLESHAQAIKDDQLTTAFYAKGCEVNQGKREVEVSGTFMTWFGKEKPPIVQTKTFVVGWELGPKGVLLVSKFEEKKE